MMKTYKEKSLEKYLDRGQRQIDLAEQIGVDQSCISGWLRSDRNISVRIFRDGRVECFETKKLGPRRHE